jgi:Zn-dependent membrane protease YugP
MFFDPLYFLFAIPGILLALWAQGKVKSAYAKYSQVPTLTGYSGQDAARILNHRNGLGVEITHTDGELTDHYDPSKRLVALSHSSQYNSIAAVAIVAHEFGHAVQHSQKDPMLMLRGAIVPVVNISSGIAPWLFMGGALLGLGSGLGSALAWLGVIGFGLAAVFALVTLPVEFDASRRALAMIRENNLLTETEMRGAKQVLDAAALTYVAAAASALLTLLYFVLRLTGVRRDD